MIGLIVILELTLAASGTPTPEATFRAAIEDFEFGEHKKASQKLRSVLEPIQLQSREDVIVARQYLGACYHLLDNRDGAESEFRLLLQMDPSHKLDPEVFSPALVVLFEDVRKQTVAAGPPPPPPPDIAPPPPPVKKASPPPPPIRIVRPPPPAEEPHSAALSVVPFGVGQFANHHPIRGTIFAVTEVGLLATALTTFVMFEGLKFKEVRPNGDVIRVYFRPEDADRASSLQTTYLVTFWSGIAVVAIGIVEALVSYPGDDPAGVSVSAGPGAMTVRF